VDVIGDHQDHCEQFQELLGSRADDWQAVGQVDVHDLILETDSLEALSM
jgi:hypothetical protein